MVLHHISPFQRQDSVHANRLVKIGLIQIRMPTEVEKIVVVTLSFRGHPHIRV